VVRFTAMMAFFTVTETSQTGYEHRLPKHEADCQNVHATDSPDTNNDSIVLNDGLLIPLPSSCLDILSQI